MACEGSFARARAARMHGGGGRQRARERSPSPAAAASAAARKQGKGRSVRVPASTQLPDGGMYPFGRSILGAIFAQDPVSFYAKIGSLSLSVFLLVAMPLLPALSAGNSAKQGWDSAHGVSMLEPCTRSWMVLLKVAAGASSNQAAQLLQGTMGVMCLLGVLDALRHAGYTWLVPDWPASWQCSNRRCYDEMFCEPTRPWPALIRRPGNVISNAIYLYGSCLVLLGSWQLAHTFCVPDALFGIMLLILFVLSVIWHASNAPTSQYIDLWSMDSTIAYLIVRFLSLAAFHALKVAAGLEPARAGLVAARGCTVCFGVVIAANWAHHWSSYKRQLLHQGCPFAGRTRLLQRGQQGRANVDIRGVCVFSCMPVLYMTIPHGVQLFALGDSAVTGSCAAATWASASLVLGWSLRMCERFCLDGCQPMAALSDKLETNSSEHGGRAACERLCIRISMALVSPTAHLHFWTGFTLVLGFCHVRTLDDQLGIR